MERGCGTTWGAYAAWSLSGREVVGDGRGGRSARRPGSLRRGVERERDDVAVGGVRRRRSLGVPRERRARGRQRVRGGATVAGGHRRGERRETAPEIGGDARIV